MEIPNVLKWTAAYTKVHASLPKVIHMVVSIVGGTFAVGKLFVRLRS